MPAKIVTVPPRVLAGLRRHAAAARPAECCGALIGSIGRECTEIRSLIPVPNSALRHDRYLMDAGAVLRIERQAAATGLHVVGFYHSHPFGSAVPSAADLELACPGYLYLIVGGPPGDVRCWRLRDDRRGFAEVGLVDAVAGAA
jgi:desampylase